jgi:pyruvate dehydrogenase E2 component (dihydrolipoamide acetyltransferase)
MPFTLTMPKLSPTMESGTLVKWHKKVGDHVEAGDLLFEVATDKATVEHNALDEGWLRKIIVEEGQEARVNQAVAIFTEDKKESIEGYKPTGLDMEAKAATEKASEEQPETKKEKAAAPKGAALSQPAFVPEPPLANYSYTQPTEALGDRVLASPLARKIAKDQGLDLSTVKGTGPNGRIMERDLELAQPAGAIAFGHREAPKAAPGSYEEEPLSPIRKVIAQRLQEAKSFIPHFYISQEVRVDSLVEIREQLRHWGVKLTFNDFVMRASALALRKHPVVNSAYNSVNQTIVKFKTIDIAVAVNIPEGLITPILRHADFKNLGELSSEVRLLAARAKEGKLDPTEYKGGSFTISNMGMYGVTSFQAIINPPQAAILSVGGIADKPVVKNGAVVPGKVMTLSLSVDHRVVDGAAAAQFIKTLQDYLEHPAGLLL